MFGRVRRYVNRFQERRKIAASSCFDASWYLNQYPDVRSSGQTALGHYLSFGAYEGRSPHPLFDAAWYVQHNPSACAVGQNPLLHYLQTGAASQQSPHPLFDVAWYLGQNPDAARSQESALSHYLRIGSARGTSPSRLFDPAFYVLQLVDGIPSDTTPFSHYLSIGERMGLRPNPHFDPHYYLATYRDAQEGGTGALLHYRLIGAAEQRNPSSEFNAGIYWDHLTLEERDEYLDCLAHYYRVGHKLGIPFNTEQARRHLVENCTNGRPTILSLLHSQGGGTEKYVYDVAELHHARINMLAMRPGSDKRLTISLADRQKKGSVSFDPSTQFGELLNFLRECRTMRLHVNHILGHESYLSALIESLAVPFDVTVHDYYLLSPQPHLTDPDGRYVGDDLLAAADKLLAAAFGPSPPASLAEWQSTFRWLLERCERLIIPSMDAARRFAAAAPDARVVLTAHPDAPAPMPKLRPSGLSGDAALRIAVLGEINPHKGSNVILTCAQLARASSDPLQFVIVGATSRELEMLATGVRVTGRFRPSDLPGLLQEIDPHLIWYPAQCPETFAYTLSEGLRTGLPLVVANLGALPERVGGQPWVWIKPWDIEPRQWNEFFKCIRVRNLLPGIPPEIVGVPWTITDAFYKDKYLDWIY